MKRSKYEIVLDTETAQNGQVMELALVVLKQRRIIAKRNFLIYGVYQVIPPFSLSGNTNFLPEMVKAKLAYYDNLVLSGSAIVASPAYIQSYFDALIAKYTNVTLWAYNINFDINVLESTNITVGAYKKRCIWELALSTVCYNRDYKKFCLTNTNKYLTPKHGFSSSAETVLDFLKSHTKAIPDGITHPHYAMPDTLGEYYILKYLSRLKLRKPLSGYSWQEHRIADHVKIK